MNQNGIAGYINKNLSHGDKLILNNQQIKQLFIMKNRGTCPRVTKHLSIQKVTIVKEKNIILIGQSPQKKNKSVDAVKKIQKMTAKVIKKEVGTKQEAESGWKFDLNEEMARCREREMAIIRKNVGLLKYYNCLIALFMIAYTSSQVMASNFFQPQRRASCLTLPLSLAELPSHFGLTFLSNLLRLYQTAKNIQLQAKLRRLAVNLLRVSPTASGFERKVEFVSRKVVLNSEKAKEIGTALVSEELESFWRRLAGKVMVSTQVDFMDDMFDLPPQRLCLRDFQVLVDQYLSSDCFEEDLKRQEAFGEAGNGQHSFSVEFLLIQKLCTQDYDTQEIASEQKKKRKYNCEIY